MKTVSRSTIAAGLGNEDPGGWVGECTHSSDQRGGNDGLKLDETSLLFPALAKARGLSGPLQEEQEIVGKNLQRMLEDNHDHYDDELIQQQDEVRAWYVVLILSLVFQAAACHSKNKLVSISPSM